jgi:hypothetical protein
MAGEERRMECVRCDLSGVETMLGWAEAEGWNPGPADASTFFSADPQGFWLGISDGQPVASLSAVAWNPDFAFVGLYIVRPEMRGQGLGWQLWQTALGQHSQGCLALDGVVAQQDNYARSGFRLAHRSLRWQGQVGQVGSLEGSLVPAASVQDKLAHLDSLVSPSDRPQYFQAWIRQAGARAWASPDGSAMALARPVKNGWKVGPLIAPDARTAHALLAACCQGLAPETPIFVDTPEPNASAQKLMQQLGFGVCFEVARMYTKPVREHRLDWLYGVTSYELG